MNTQKMKIQSKIENQKIFFDFLKFDDKKKDIQKYKKSFKDIKIKDNDIEHIIENFNDVLNQSILVLKVNNYKKYLKLLLSV